MNSERNLDPSASFRYKRKAKKRPWNTLITWSKFSQMEVIFFRINYEIRGRHYWKQQICSCKLKRSVGMTKSKTNQSKNISGGSHKVSSYRQSHVHIWYGRNYIALAVWYGLDWLNWIKFLHQDGESWWQNSDLQLTRSRKKKQKNEIGVEKHGFKPRSRRKQDL